MWPILPTKEELLRAARQTYWQGQLSHGVDPALRSILYNLVINRQKAWNNRAFDIRMDFALRNRLRQLRKHS